MTKVVMNSTCMLANSMWFSRLIDKIFGKRCRCGSKKEGVQETATLPPQLRDPASWHIDRHDHNKQSLPDFNSMEKIDLDIWARQNNMTIDRRKSKENVIKEITLNLETKEK